MTTIAVLPILKDNYAYVLAAPDGNAAVIDPGAAEPVLAYLNKHRLRLTHILNTHHHGDHCAGNIALKQATGAIIIAPAAEADAIGSVDHGVVDGDRIVINHLDFQVMATPGHTLGSVCFYLPALKTLFTGDTLFSLGCGRLFEGTAEDLWRSFQKVMTLPDDTMIYPGHEYTLANGAFCLHIKPNNTDLQERIAESTALQKQGQPTIPAPLAVEKKTNVFLRAHDANQLSMLRKEKDKF
ncbi:MAG: hydroxyacylglutathione hydrolase [Alphaproteobacteria bacterium]|nr:hydroxyacylglutathione hydrolase [Alphaproteobacteria bacterium]